MDGEPAVGPREGPASEYTIATGVEETARLATQAAVMARATSRLVDEVGVAPGWRCLDVGAGGGQVSRLLGDRVAPTGQVVGVDLSPSAVHSAQADTLADGVVRFRQADAYTLPFQEEFDLAYARLLLTHLAEPVAALREMAAAVVPGGVVAVEDLFADTLRSEPATPALEDLRRVYGATVRAHGGDPTIGPRLPALLRRAGLERIRATSVVNEMHATAEKRFLVELVDTMRDAMVSTAAATAAEVDRMRAGVAAAAEDEGCTFFQARIHQVYGYRPA